MKKDIHVLGKTAQVYDETEDLITECYQITNQKVVLLTLSPCSVTLGQINMKEISKSGANAGGSGGMTSKTVCPKCNGTEVWRPDGLELVCMKCNHMWMD